MTDLEQRQQASDNALDTVAARRIEAIEKSGGTFDKIAQELCSIAFARIDDYVTIDKDGIVCTKTPEQIRKTRNGKRKLGAVKKIKQRTTSTESKDGETAYVRCELEYELHDKMDALKYLVRLRGEEPGQKHELTGKDGGPMQLTNFPPTAKDLDEWQRQMEEAETQRMSRERGDEG